MILYIFLFYSFLQQISATPSIIVIGAGASGIAAASKLYENGFKNIKILEAENRIGGRVRSVYFGEAFIDLGAEWSQGENVIYNLVKDYNLLQPSGFTGTVNMSSQRLLDDQLISDVDTFIANMMEESMNADRNQSTEDYIVSRFDSFVKNYSKGNPQLENDIRLFQNVLENELMGGDGSFSWSNVPAVADYTELEGDQYMNWNGFGFKTIIEVLLKKFPDPSQQLPINILLNKEVNHIRWKDSTVQIKCQDNSEYQADHVIFTPSVGVLKADHMNLFEPSLPKEKQEAIEHLGFDAIMKVLVYYKTRWWNDENFTGYRLMWTDEDIKLATEEFPEGPIDDERRWVTSIFHISPGERNPNVLYFWVVGRIIPKIETLPENILSKGVKYVSNKFFGSKSKPIPSPDALIRSTWYTNPHFRGTYSYQTMSTERGENSDETKLMQPLSDDDGKIRLLFAGEATNPLHYGTVHGAIETGFREADRIISMYQHK